MSITALVLVCIAGLHSVCTVGVTGGPNHGEHPFVVSIVHLVVFLILGRGWPSLSFSLYLAGLLAAVVAGFFALRFAVDRPKVRWPLRAVFGLIYGGLRGVLIWRP